MKVSARKKASRIVELLLIASMAWINSCAHSMAPEVIDFQLTPTAVVTNYSHQNLAFPEFSSGASADISERRSAIDTEFADYNFVQFYGYTSERVDRKAEIKTLFTFNNYQQVFRYSLAGVSEDIDMKDMCVSLTTLDGSIVEGTLEMIDDEFVLLKTLIDSTEHISGSHIIERSEIQDIRMNASLDLFAIMSYGLGDIKPDRIELESGTMINCLVLEVSADTIHYFDATNLKRQSIPNSAIAAVHLKDGFIEAPLQSIANNYTSL